MFGIKKCKFGAKRISLGLSYRFMSLWAKDGIENMCVDKTICWKSLLKYNAENFISFESVLPCFKTILNALRKSS